MTSLPPARRIVTGHDASGKAIIESDTTFSPIDPHATIAVTKTSDDGANPAAGGMKDKGGFILLWRTDSFPAKVSGPWEDYHGKPLPLADKIGTTVRIVDMPPGLSSPMHRTESLDFGVVLTGEVVLELDDGAETTVRQGQTVVQRATIHAWHNRTNEMARVLFILLPSETATINGKRLGKTNFSVN
ncbi:hypothetical protein G7Y89_g10320 [Cudoniella acicularis]|uniref:Cupin type-2 domain-containing protein n=1 Tax=Cudoniella acicularis TaxID=354080 RepID=A0A8H4RGQ1_9HELO|nr:hypothetical protein G7Y89_g10320 [Cudoniella acicularis]